MKTFDRTVLLALTVGVWALVATILFNPTQTISHPSPENCTGTGWGNIEELEEGGEVFVYAINLSC